VSERAVAYSTGLMNIGSSLIGNSDVPRCRRHGRPRAVRGAHGGSSIILGSVLLVAGLFLSSSIDTIFGMFPQSVLGVILFLAGLQLALGSRDVGAEKADRFVVLATAAFAIWNVGVAVLSAYWYTTRRGAGGCGSKPTASICGPPGESPA